MLRQIHIFYETERIFTHSYALGLGIKELDNVIEIIRSYMDMPLPGKMFKKPLSDFQVFHQGKGKLYYIIITDQIDSLQYLEKKMKKMIEKFSELYPNPLEISQDNKKKSDFLKFLNLLQKDLHSKISITGPFNAGKTTLYNKLRVEGTERNIMDFAKSSSFVIDNLTFDIWDFQLEDNSSLLWSKFISGSDLNILIFDISNYNLQVLDRFLTLKRREGKLSNLLILANKVDLIDEAKLRKIENNIKIQDYNLISLKDEYSKTQVLNLIRKALNLRTIITKNFESLIRRSQELEENGRLVKAIKNYKELIKLSNKNQLFSYVKNFETKVSELNKKIQDKVEIKRKLERKRKFAAPQTIKFQKKVKVKTLPGNSLNSKSNKTPLRPPPSKNKKNSIQNELKISPDDIKTNLKLIGKRKVNKKNEDNISNEKTESFADLEDHPLMLQKIIKSKGSSLSIDLCSQYISEMQTSLGRSLEYSDIEIAADIFVKQEEAN